MLLFKKFHNLSVIRTYGRILKLNYFVHLIMLNALTLLDKSLRVLQLPTNLSKITANEW